VEVGGAALAAGATVVDILLLYASLPTVREENNGRKQKIRTFAPCRTHLHRRETQPTAVVSIIRTHTYLEQSEK
jgi:hypothetical protein